MNRTQMAKVIRIAVYAMLVISAGATFLAEDRLWQAARTGDLPTWAAILPVCAFTMFVVVYTIDRLLLVKRRNYPTGRAFFQVVFGLLFIGLLWPGQVHQLRETRTAAANIDRDTRMLRHHDPEVRAFACEQLATRTDLADEIAIRAEVDHDAAVREACNAALERMRAGVQRGADSMGL